MIKNRWIKSAVLAVLSFAITWVLIVVISLVAYGMIPDIGFFEDFLLLTCIGSVVIFLGGRAFGLIFLGSLVLGYAVGCTISYFQYDYPTMKGAFYNMAIIAIGVITGAVVQIVVIRKKRI